MFSLIYTAYVSLEHVVNIDYVLDSIPRFSIRVLERFGVIRRRWVTNEEMIYCNHCVIFGHTANVLTNNDDIYKVCFLRSYHDCINFL